MTRLKSLSTLALGNIFGLASEVHADGISMMGQDQTATVAECTSNLARLAWPGNGTLSLGIMLLGVTIFSVHGH